MKFESGPCCHHFLGVPYTYLNQCGGWGRGVKTLSPISGKLVTSIPSRGDRLCPPHYYYPYIFGPYDTSEFFTLLKFDAPKFCGKTNPFLFINLTMYVFIVWHSRLWTFQGRDTKLERFLAKIQLYSNEIIKF